MDIKNSEIQGNDSSSEYSSKSIKELEALINECERTQNYIEASKIHKTLLDLTIKKKRKEEDRQIEQEQMALYEKIVDFNTEYTLFTDHWNELIENHHNNFKNQKAKSKSDFEKEFESVKKQLENSILINPTFSEEFKTVKNVQNQMAKDKEYGMAAIMKTKLADFECEERNKWKKARKKEIKIRLKELKTKHKKDTKKIEILEKAEMKKLCSRRYAERMVLIKKYKEAKGLLEKAKKVFSVENMKKQMKNHYFITAVVVFGILLI